MATLKSLRETRKNEFKTKLKELLQLKLFKQLQNDLSLNKKYEILIINEKYRQQLLDASLYAYSICGNQPTAIMFQLALLDRYDAWKSKIDHLMKTGTYIMLIEMKTNIIAAGFGFVDLCDYYAPVIRTNKGVSSNYSDLQKVIESGHLQFCEKNKEFKKLWNNKYILSDNELNRYYGKWCCTGYFWARPDVRNKGLMFFMHMLLTGLLCELNYKYRFGDIVNERSLSFALQGGAKIMVELKLIEFKGINFKKYLNDLKYKYNYSNNIINKFKNASYCIMMNQVYSKMKFYKTLKDAINSYKKSSQNKSKL
eukprot:68464_1